MLIRKGTVSIAVLSEWVNAITALRSYRHRKGIRTGKVPMTSSAVKRMIPKFLATSRLDDRPRSGQPTTSSNVARTVQEEMEIVAGSSMHGVVSAREVACHTDIPYITV